MARRIDGPVVLGAILVVLGALFLAGQLAPVSFDVGHYGWPVVVILPGLAFLAFGLFLDGASGLVIPGSIITIAGLVLAVQNTFDLFATWAYAWALVAPGGYGSPRRATTGIDVNRVLMLIAVLARHAGVNLSGHDVYVNVAGGLRIEEPAADLAIATALASSLRERPVRAGTVLAGELSLSGRLRAASRAWETSKRKPQPASSTTRRITSGR